ncbi:MAG TPA: DNA methyltransferase [Pseudomonadales bacterium]|nr:DNA methyltransferase [Pseudomonadales bacterium]
MANEIAPPIIADCSGVQDVRQIGPATLYLADSLFVLPQLREVDALICDPPYSSGGQFRGDRMQTTGVKYVMTGTQMVRPDFDGDNRDQRSFEYWCVLWLSAALAACKPGAVACLFTDWRQLPSTSDALQGGGWVWRGVVPWDKTNGCRPSMGRFAAQCEYLAWGSAGPLPQDRGVGCLPGLFSHGVERNKPHITSKPIRLMEDVVQICPVGGLVLDPFMGAGSTGVAAVRHGRRFIGIERNAEYFEKSCERIENALANRSLFTPDEAPVTGSMFGAEPLVDPDMDGAA